MQSAAAIAQGLARRDAEDFNRNSKFLYNGSHDEAFVTHYNSVRYIIPPDGETLRACDQDELVARVTMVEKRGPIHRYDGTLQVFDIWDAPKEKWVEYRRARKDPDRRDKVKPPQRNQVKTTCNAVVSFVSGNYGSRGLVILTGDPEQDAMLRQQAKALYIKYDMKRCEKIVETYHEYVSKFKAKAQNIGNKPRRMSQIEQHAQQKLDLYRKNTEELAEVMECPAPDCGFWAPNGPGSQESMTQHIESQHGGNIVDQAGQFVGRLGLEPEPAPQTSPAPARPAPAEFVPVKLSEEEFRAKVAALSAAYEDSDEEEREILGEQLQSLEQRKPDKIVEPKAKRGRSRPQTAA